MPPRKTTTTKIPGADTKQNTTEGTPTKVSSDTRVAGPAAVPTRRPSVEPISQPGNVTRMPTTSTSQQSPNPEEIRQRAYQLYEERGRQQGRHEEDWCRAEQELRDRYSKSTKRSA